VCYAHGGVHPTVTDANVALGRIAPQGFAGGRMTLDAQSASAAIERDLGAPLGLDAHWAAAGISEMVEENMANAARVHAIERGKSLADCVMVAFGGGAPLHAARLAEKLGMTRLVIPVGASVGSAIGFLQAPVSYELARSAYAVDASMDLAAINALLASMAEEARGIVAPGASGAPMQEARAVDVRYLGQGHELSIPLPARALTPADIPALRATFEERYRAQYGLSIPGLSIEFLTWTVTVSTQVAAPARIADVARTARRTSDVSRRVFDATDGAWIDVPVFERAALTPGNSIVGPALIAEAQTTTYVPPRFAMSVNASGYLDIAREQ
jgi:N-methylhydantoinase A